MTDRPRLLELYALHELASAMPPPPARFDVGRVAMHELQQGRWPAQVQVLAARAAGLPPALCPAVRVDDDLELTAWRAIGSDGQVMAEGHVDIHREREP